MNIARVVLSLAILALGAVLAWKSARAPRAAPTARCLVSWDRPDRASLRDWRAERDLREWLERGLEDEGLSWEARSGGYSLVLSSTGVSALSGLLDRWNVLTVQERGEDTARRRSGEEAAAKAREALERRQAALARFNRLLDEMAVASTTPASPPAPEAAKSSPPPAAPPPEPRPDIGSWATAHRKAPDLTIGLKPEDQRDDALLFECLAVLEGNLGADLHEARGAVLERIRELEKTAGASFLGGTGRVLLAQREAGARDLELWREAARLLDGLLADREAGAAPEADPSALPALKLVEEPVFSPTRGLRGRDLTPLLWAAALCFVLNLLWELRLPPRREEPAA